MAGPCLRMDFGLYAAECTRGTDDAVATTQKPIQMVEQHKEQHIVQELCESRGGRPGLSVLTSLLVSVDVKIYCTVLRHWSQLVPNMSHDI